MYGAGDELRSKGSKCPCNSISSCLYNEVRSSTAGRRCHSCCRNCSRTCWCSCKSLRDSVTNNSSSLGRCWNGSIANSSNSATSFATSGSQQYIPATNSAAKWKLCTHATESCSAATHESASINSGTFIETNSRVISRLQYFEVTRFWCNCSC